MTTTPPAAGPLIFADGIQDAHVANGVVRITLAMLGGDGKAAPAGVVVLPLSQLGAFANGVVTLTRQVEAKVREAQQQAGQTPAPAGGEAGFRFGT
jgi:hypothetical protein